MLFCVLFFARISISSLCLFMEHNIHKKSGVKIKKTHCSDKEEAYV